MARRSPNSTWQGCHVVLVGLCLKEACRFEIIVVTGWLWAVHIFEHLMGFCKRRLVGPANSVSPQRCWTVLCSGSRMADPMFWVASLWAHHQSQKAWAHSAWSGELCDHSPAGFRMPGSEKPPFGDLKVTLHPEESSSRSSRGSPRGLSVLVASLSLAPLKENTQSH